MIIDNQFSQSEPMTLALEIRPDQETGLILYNTVENDHFCT